jgi:hypothetical protein
VKGGWVINNVIIIFSSTCKNHHQKINQLLHEEHNFENLHHIGSHSVDPSKIYEEKLLPILHGSLK